MPSLSPTACSPPRFLPQVVTAADYNALYQLFGYSTVDPAAANYLTYSGTQLGGSSSLAVQLFADNQKVASIMAVGANVLSAAGEAAGKQGDSGSLCILPLGLLLLFCVHPT